MNRLLLRARLALASLLRPRTIAAQEDVCWCGIHHLGDYWHDPTHGRIDRDIQDKVTARYGDDLTLAQREAIESTIQHRRDRELSV